MKTEEGTRQDFARGSSHAPPAARSQFWGNGEMSGWVSQQHGGVQKEHLKDEKPQINSICSLENFCQSFFKPSQTCSAEPEAGIPDSVQEVFNNGEYIAADMHFNQGDSTDKEEAKTGLFDWVRQVPIKRKKTFPCTQCGKTFPIKSLLRAHERIHTGEKPYQCLLCGRSFREKKSLRCHQNIHTGEKPYHCSLCGKGFNRRTALQDHQRIHTGEKPYPCSECGKCFSAKSGLRIHERIHTGEKPYHCTKCGKRFAAYTQYLWHQNTHTGVRPYHCTKCEKRFASYPNYKRHQITHTGARPYLCPECGKCYSTTGALKTHLQHIHKKEKTSDPEQNKD